MSKTNTEIRWHRERTHAMTIAETENLLSYMETERGCDRLWSDNEMTNLLLHYSECRES